MALEAFPPLVLIGARFTLSGSILIAGARLAGSPLPRGRELWRTALYGVIILGVGNGALTFAELIIPSGLAALFITASPFWMVGIEALMPGGERLHLPTSAGMLVGFLGAALLVGPDAIKAGLGSSLLQGFLILQLGCASWSFGSIMQRRQDSKAHPFVSGGVQQFAAGVSFLLLSAVFPEPAIQWNWRSTGALLYLVAFGSIVGYSAFIYCMEHLPVAVVSIYNYVNPIVAVFLGWLIYREPFGRRETMAMLVIFVGVAIVKLTTAGASHRSQAARK